MPWLFWATDRVLDRPDAATARRSRAGRRLRLPRRPHPDECPRAARGGVYVVAWRAGRGTRFDPRWRIRSRTWAIGVAGWGWRSPRSSIVPLWVYLGEEPGLGRPRAGAALAPERLTRPRVLDAVCTAIPYAFGSQRRGHPNLARALGVHNLNESAGGFAGLATLIWLAPQAWRRVGRSSSVRSSRHSSRSGSSARSGSRRSANLLRALPVAERHRPPTAHALGRLRAGPARGGRARSALGALAATGGTLLGPRSGVAVASGLSIGVVSVARAEPWLRARAEALRAAPPSRPRGRPRGLSAPGRPPGPPDPRPRAPRSSG